MVVLYMTNNSTRNDKAIAPNTATARLYRVVLINEKMNFATR